MSEYMGITGFLPSMFNGLKKIQEQNKIHKDEKELLRRENSKNRIESFIETEPCRNCGNSLIFIPQLEVGQCKKCGKEYSYEYLKYNPPRRKQFTNLKSN